MNRKRQRGYVLQRLTKLKDRFDRETDLDVTTAMSMLQMIPEIKQNLEKTHDEYIETLESEIEQSKEHEVFESAMDKLFDLELSLRAVVNTTTITQDTTPRDRTAIVTSKMKLPPISIPEFSGDYMDWKSFRDAFECTVHKQTSLDDCQKFQYLRDNLKGNALAFVKHIPITSENYASVWNMLIQRYENKNAIVTSHLKALFSHPSSKDDDYSSLRALSNVFQTTINAVDALGVTQRDAWVVHLVTGKLDKRTLELWNEKLEGNDIPSCEQLAAFLHKRCNVLERTGKSAAGKTTNQTKKSDNQPKPRSSASLATETTRQHENEKRLECSHCKADHTIYKCDTFRALPLAQRIQRVTDLKLCSNCLRPAQHSAKECPSGRCRICKQEHSSLLHKDANVQGKPQTEAPQEDSSSADTIKRNQTVSVPTARTTRRVVLLPTAIVMVRDAFNHTHPCRVLLDSTSQDNFISEETCQKLRLKKKHANTLVTGIGESQSRTSKQVTVQVESRHSNFSSTFECLVLPKVVSNLPQETIDLNDWNPPDGVIMADPWFYQSNKIDMLLGTAAFYETLGTESIIIKQLGLRLQKTVFGWTIVGELKSDFRAAPSEESLCMLTTTQHSELVNLVSKLWEIEEVKREKPPLSDEQQRCEDIFTNTTKRNSSGRFVVKLPIKTNARPLGDSREIALKRFLTLERNLAKDSVKRDLYHEFMREYIELSHMSLEENPNEKSQYLPHHAVLRPDSSTTKLRVVFDGSMKTTSGVSVNECLMVGATVQDSLFEILLRFRFNKIGVTSDVKMMYRMIEIAQEDRHLTSILWRFHPSEPIRTYTLNTVTYGTSCAPFLATRCVNQLANDEKDNFPKAAAATKNFYVDDYIGGAESDEEALELYKQLSGMFSTCGMSLRKWSSNSEKLLENIPPENRELASSKMFDSEATVKTLGLIWNPTSDKFHFNELKIEENVTKRSMLTTIARVFDPLGSIAPVTIQGKVLVQKAFEERVNWDDEVSGELKEEWLRYKSELTNLPAINFPRYVGVKPAVEIIGYCDASEKAYGACVYVLSEDSNGKPNMHLLCAKTRVAPSKNRQTIPRLELMGAVLLAELMEKVMTAVSIPVSKAKCYTDSMIVLHYLRSDDPARWKTFVANTVALINEIIPHSKWAHVRSASNPADCLSRGCSVSELMNNELWWHGSIHSSESEPEIEVSQLEYSKEGRLKASLSAKVTTDSTNAIRDLIEKCSSYWKLVRIVAWCLRYIECVKNPERRTSFGKHLHPGELQKAIISIVKVVQNDVFSDVRTKLENKAILPKKAAKLCPFLDNEGVIRVGGRLQSAELPEHHKHQILLPDHHHFTNLVVKNAHMDSLHGGPQLTMSVLREFYWPHRALHVVNRVIRNCLICFKMSPPNFSQLMGNLPATRVNPARAFLHSSVDYCGPFHLKPPTRKSAPPKVHVAVFVCHSTRAVHLELVDGLSTEAFLRAYARFTSTRGVPASMTSDNATTFVGAERELGKMYSAANHQQKVTDVCSIQGTKWNFIPPRTPHFGGLHEAAVKSFKHHFRRIATSEQLTSDEMNTLIKRIESCLNSRPIGRLSSSPADPDPLTPAHFLVLGSLKSIPEPDLDEIPMNRLSRWQLISSLHQRFWNRWVQEYLHFLQQRGKWETPTRNLEVGAVVLLRDEQMPPNQWRTGIVEELHPGRDGRVRVVSVRTTNGVFKRGITKIVPLFEA